MISKFDNFLIIIQILIGWLETTINTNKWLNLCHTYFYTHIEFEYLFI